MKKLLCGFILCVPLLTKACVSPIPGENLWRLTSRIGFCTDQIGSNISNLATSIDSIASSIDLLVCAVGELTPLTQALFDANPGGIFITTPGLYQFCEDITSPSNGIIINSGDVTLDLGGFYLNGANVTVGPGISNVTVRNGTIKNVPTGINIDNSIGMLMHNITIDTITIDTITSAFTFHGIGATSGGIINGLTIRNIQIYNGSPFNIVVGGAPGTLVSNLIIENIEMVGTNPAFTVVGTESAILLQYCQSIQMNNVVIQDQIAGLYGMQIDNSQVVSVQNVTVTSNASLTGTPSGIYLTNSDFVQFDNCAVYGGTNKAFAKGMNFDVTNGNTINVNNCLVEDVSNNAFTIASANLVMENCFASNAFIGFFVSNICLIENCTAQNITGDGFELLSAASALDATVENCFAEACSNGCIVAANYNLLNNVIAINNINLGIGVSGDFNTIIGSQASNNGGIGFGITGNRCSFDECTANHNSSSGFQVVVSGESPNGCYISNSIANYNLLYGITVQGVAAEGLFLLGSLTANTMNIGQVIQTGPTFNTLNDGGVRLINNFAIGNGQTNNGRNSIVMSGTVSDTGAIPASPQSFGPVLIFPSIGMIGTIQGTVVQGPSPYTPYPTTQGGAANQNVNGLIVNPPGCNIIEHGQTISSV